MNDLVYVFGHKNPDTDSIVSAIAYAEFKRQQGVNAVACRIGSTNTESEFLLDKFGFDEPRKIFTARSLLKEVEMDKASLVSKDMTMKDALEKITKTKNRVLIVGDKQKHLEGLVSVGDLTYMWTKTDKELENIIKTIKTENILKTLKGKLVLEGSRKLSGKMHIFPSLKSRVELDSIVLLRNEDDKIKYSLGLGAALIIVVTSSPVSKQIIKVAKECDATIITTDLSPLSVTRLIYQTPTIENVMTKKDIVMCFGDDETVQDATKKLLKSRHRSYPVINDEGKVIGAISRYHLFNYQKKGLILVDHNEYKQSIENIEDGEILEIVDHHRLGGFESENPINIITKSVGSTATIITNLFFEHNLKISKKMAGLLLGAVISDTMNFNSPTTTKTDIDTAKKLEKISGIKSNVLSKEMIEHSDSILSKRFIEIVYDDFKEFDIDGIKVGLSQTLCKSKEDFEKIKKDLQSYLDDSCKTGSYDVMLIMLTNPNGSGSYVLSAGNRKSIIKDVFGNEIKGNYVKGLLSRKKQLLPKVIKAISEK